MGEALKPPAWLLHVAVAALSAVNAYNLHLLHEGWAREKELNAMVRECSAARLRDSRTEAEPPVVRWDCSHRVVLIPGNVMYNE